MRISRGAGSSRKLLLKCRRPARWAGLLAFGVDWHHLALAVPGVLDSTFGDDGRVTTNFTAGEDLASGVAIRAGRIVAAGRAGGFGRSGRFALSRYLVA